eukprot:scaffold27055_cov155-Skeletonema_menzelii.AAC.12
MASAPAAPSHPPWQVRWKRPQWERVQAGITDPDHDSSYDGDDSHNNIRSSSTSHENFEFQNDDIQTNDLDPNWIPISSSSITLTRREAHAAILELRRRDKLLIRRRRRRTTPEDIISPTTEGDNVDLTPLVDNAKSIQPQQDESSDNNKNPENNTAVPIAAETTASLSGKWFASKIGVSSNKSTPSRPPRGAGGSSKSSSPSSFSTFGNFMSPPRKWNKNKGEIDKLLDQNNNDEDEDVLSPPRNTATDASTASSLLWEDRTLTSVSEEDAAAFRSRHGKKSKTVKTNDYLTNDTIDASTPVQERNKALAKLDYDDIDWEEEGFENVVLLVTVFASTKEQSERNLSTGDVVVMELMSTQDPPLPTSIDHGDNHNNNGSGDVTTTSRSKQQQQQQRRSSQMKVSASSSSSLTTPSPSSISQRSSRGGGGGGGSVSYDSSSLSKTVNTQQHQEQYVPNHGEEVETPSNHSRLLSRRVMRWPTSVVSKLSSNSSKGDGCPAFVALGRTTVVEENSNFREVSSNNNIKLNPKTGGRTLSLKDVSSRETRITTDDDDRIADAMDAIRSLNFLIGGERSNATTSSEWKDTVTAQGDTKTESPDNVDTIDSATKKKQPLSLCFVTNDGYAHFFHAMRLLLSHKSVSSSNAQSSESDSLSNSFASFVMGSELFTKLRQDVAPLSRPSTTVKLSQLTGMKETGGDSLIWKDIVSSDSESGKESDYDHDKKKDATKSNWANLTSFDASIDPATVSLRTLRHTNIVTGSCFTSDKNNSHLAVCGKGLRRNLLRGKKIHSLGGFVTFVSLRHYAESKTIYLPFAPRNIHPVYWRAKHFVIISGERGTYGGDHNPCAVIVRVDSTQGGLDTMQSIDVKRFYPVPIKLPSINESLGLFSLTLAQEQTDVCSEIIGVSSIPSSPPGILVSYQNLSAEEAHATTTVVVNHTLDLSKNVAVGAEFAFLTTVRPGHRVLIDDTAVCETSPNEVAAASTLQQNNMWCTGGQGWSLIGRHNTNSYFVCWDGATESDGPFVLQFERIKATSCVASGVIPLIGSHSQIQSYDGASTFFTKPPSTPSLFRLEERDDFLTNLSCSLTIKESIKLTAASEGGIDDVLVRALDSISNEPERRSSRSKKIVLSHKAKSSRMLRHCSSWTQLQSRRTAYGQVLFAFARFGTQLQSLSLRTNALQNPLSTPFNHVLSWLCQRRDYYTAASVALSLLDDADAVYDLRGIAKTGDAIGELSIHKRLIDGITPLCIDGGSRVTMTSLADMAVGCLIKGGAEMSSALEGFLLRNELYDASDTCLMLVGAATVAVSQDTSLDLKLTEGQNIVTMLSSVESPKLETIWPVRCLLKMAVVRNCLRSTLLVLNAAIPNELRWRAPQRIGVVSTKRPSLGLFVALVGTILESSNEATRVLLDLLDEESGMPFWFSIEEDTRLALSLLSVHGKYVMIQEPEVRAWALERLKTEIEFPSKHKYHHIHSHLPDEWLREIVSGIFCKAETEIGLGVDSSNVTNANDQSPCYREAMRSIRDLLIPNNRCGLDFDLLIAALLILAHRHKEWREGSATIPTQILLNAVCEMAGKRVESKFVFDSATVLRQCALAENIQAAALIVGGKNGLILECVDLITSKMDIEIKDAETALFAATVNEFKDMMDVIHQNFNLDEESEFTPSGGQFHLLWLLEEHVLSVVKYGEFDSPRNSEKLEPVFVGRLCFRAWYSLTHPTDRSESAKWLESWLRSKLELSDGKSSKRLACAALVRVLLWVDEAGQLDLGDSDEDSILATLLGFDSRFISELAQACCGLIQSIPPHLADEVITGMNHFSFEASGSLLNAS